MSGGSGLSSTQWTVAIGDVVVQPAGEAWHGRGPISAAERLEPFDSGNASKVLGDMVGMRTIHCSSPELWSRRMCASTSIMAVSIVWRAIVAVDKQPRP
jgi:hypothetical protein